jgi:peptidoglycan/xylan/chitin deacetylase (PgdA/CDA1 family)
MIPILMYHSIQRVSRKEIMRSIHVSPLSFKIQMLLLKAMGYRGCSVSEAIKVLRTGRDEKLVALTFDDGYRNFIKNALPTLERYGFSATVYIVSDLIGDSNRWDRDTGISPNELMTIDEIKHCASKGIEIGCHSATHAKLTEVKTDRELQRELLTSKQHLERSINNPVNAFCYPYGLFNETIVQHVKRCGYESATTMIRGRADRDDDPLQLPRIPVNWHTLPHLFIAKIVTTYEDKRGA